MTSRYLEDYAVGQVFGSGRVRVEEERIRSFATEFDPQPFHLDAEAAARSVFRGLAASGWHTAAMTMRLFVDSELKPEGGIVGMGFDEFRWPRPVRPGDELRLESEVMEVSPSASRPAPERLADVPAVMPSGPVTAARAISTAIRCPSETRYVIPP